MNNKEKISGIYKWINKVNGKYYVGSSMDILSNVGRKTNHLYMLRGKYHNNEHFQRAWNKYGEENFEFIVIENLPDITDKELLQIEQKYLDIAKLERDKCYNKSFIAGKIEMTTQTRKKIADKTTARLKDKNNHHMFGKHHKSETKQKISNSLIGKMAGDKNPMYGKKLNKAHPFCSGIFNRKGVANGRHKKTIYKLKNIITNEIFIGTQYDFYKKYDFSRDCIRNLITGKCNIIDRQWILFDL